MKKKNELNTEILKAWKKDEKEKEKLQAEYNRILSRLNQMRARGFK
jgi:hypothetical protein